MKAFATALVASSLIFVMPPHSAIAAKAKPVPGCKLKTPSGLGYAVLKKGKGASPKDSEFVTVNYKGSLAKNGAEFDAGRGAQFPVAGVIPGFAEGLKRMNPGARFRLCIPAKLGYGARALPEIPANSDLIFEVDLLKIEPAPVEVARKLPPAAPVAERSCVSKTSSGLGYTVKKAGSGAMPSNTDVVLINYAGFLAADGTAFDASDRMPLPVDGVIPGFTEGLKLMQRGGQYKLCVPAALGYGPAATGPIPANSDLVFDVELIDFKSMAELRGAMEQGTKPDPATPQ